MLIFHPTVHTLTNTSFNHEQFRSWIETNDLRHDVSIGSDTPIERLWNDSQKESDYFAGERLIEFAGRHCYRSWKKGRDRGAYLRNLIDSGHGSVLEHATITFAIQGVSRSLTHELIRHRVGTAVSQESQRYVAADDANFIVPPLVHELTASEKKAFCEVFEERCKNSVKMYREACDFLTESMKNQNSDMTAFELRKRCNEAARSLLPNSVETRLVWTANYRMLRHFFMLRGGAGADLEIRSLAVVMLARAKQIAPTVFADLKTENVEGIGSSVPIIVQEVL